MNGTNCRISISILQARLYFLTVLVSPRSMVACILIARFQEQRARMIKNLVKDFIADESGATAIEYGLIAAGISLAIIAIVNGLGTRLNAKFTAINTSLK